MAIFSIRFNPISRSKGSSAMKTCAYILGERLKDSTIEKTYFFKKQEVIFSKTFTPFGTVSPQELWQKAEDAEVKINSITGKILMAALPKELTKLEQIELVERYSKSIVKKYGIGVSLAIHDHDGKNPHLHLLMTTRNILPSGELGKKNRSINQFHELQFMKKLFCEEVNLYLPESDKISHLSNIERNIEYLPTKHEGYSKKHSRSNELIRKYNKTLEELKELEMELKPTQEAQKTPTYEENLQGEKERKTASEKAEALAKVEKIERELHAEKQKNKLNTFNLGRKNHGTYQQQQPEQTEKSRSQPSYAGFGLR